MTGEIPCVAFEMAGNVLPMPGDPAHMTSNPSLCNHILHSLCAEGEIDFLFVAELTDLGTHIARVKGWDPDLHTFNNVSRRAEECGSLSQEASCKARQRLQWSSGALCTPERQICGCCNGARRHHLTR